mmetsp:Transcript_21232/g.30387  ORF Transcript_21232/g.30387 Transcript_21232/m.30387 type:complete len:81 (+) Transcript_21232:75-317(+)
MERRKKGGGNLPLQKTKGVNTRRGVVPSITATESKSNNLSQTLRRHDTSSSGDKLIPPMKHNPRNDSCRLSASNHLSQRK